MKEVVARWRGGEAAMMEEVMRAAMMEEAMMMREQAAVVEEKEVRAAMVKVAVEKACDGKNGGKARLAATMVAKGAVAKVAMMVCWRRRWRRRRW